MPSTTSTRGGPSILIAGGGIGGLTLALCLHRMGIACRVFESAGEIRPLGVGLNLLPHSARVLTVLGLAPALAASGIETRELVYYSKHGRRIWSEPRGRHAGYRWPQYSIHRGALQLLLLRAVRERLGDDAVLEGHRLVGFEERDGAVVASFAGRDGGARATARGDVLVGADGIHSTVRAAFYPDEQEPKFSGRLLWRSVTRSSPFLTGESMIMAGHASQKFVAYPISPQARDEGASLVNWVAELTIGGDEEPTRDWNREVDRDRFAPAFEAWRFDWLDVPHLIADSGPVYEFPMSDRDPIARWSFSRTTLLGDAAHPMYPIGSNGASQAILDAAALAQALAEVDDLPAALQRYEAERLEPTSRIVLANRGQGPEAVMQIVEDRAPQGFARLGDVISDEELKTVASGYKRVAGFDLEALNARGETSLV
ncbi:MAG: flavin-dependent oxidoreductase [Dehalococcoidia bacterium]|nr:flavin-dependent oxidoreductase [Dehalococcoidia bacterium]